MAEFYTDTQGVRWGVMNQSNPKWCALASVAMTEVYTRSEETTNMESVFKQISQEFPNPYSDSAGVLFPDLVEILRCRGVNCYDSYNCSPSEVWSYLYSYAKDATPVIAGINFGPEQRRHATVCVCVHKKPQKCVFLDPFFGLVELHGSKLPAYKVRSSTGAVIANGTLNGELIITKD